MKFRTFMESTTFTMYHGGGNWKTTPEIRPAKQGRYEAGVGIYLCTSYNTAAKYARGSKVITICEVDRSYRDASLVHVQLQDAVEFLMNNRIKNKQRIIADLKNHCQRLGSETFTASILNNLVVNHEAGSGKAGIALVQFLVSQGVDAVRERQSTEDWLVVFNPAIIKSHKKLDRNSDNIVWDLPKITS